MEGWLARRTCGQKQLKTIALAGWKLVVMHEPVKSPPEAQAPICLALYGCEESAEESITVKRIAYASENTT